MKNNRTAKIASAVIVSVIVILLFLSYVMVPVIVPFLTGAEHSFLLLLLFPSILGLAFIVFIAIVLRERIKEINKGQEDDLEKY